MTKTICMTVLAVGFCLSATQAAEKPYVPEAGSAETGAKKTMRLPYDESLPDVLIIGDSISIGYTRYVELNLRGAANVIHSPGNSQGTKWGVENIDHWLENDKPWAVIHFNWGLHDFKRKGNGGNSGDPKAPRQSELDVYEKNMELLVSKLVATKAKLIFATTTPFPSGVSPRRDPEDAIRYNAAALRVMKKNNVLVDDLYTVIQPKLAELQKPANVHFTKKGSQLLAEAVAKSIRSVLEEK